MRVANGIEIGPIEGLSDEELKDALDKIIKFAKSNPQSPEREYFDFKRELNFTTKEEKFEIRKIFSAFANTRGGWIIVGIAEKRDNRQRIIDYEVVGVQNPSSYGRIRNILSADEYIRPRIEFQSRNVMYKGKQVLIYYIAPEHRSLVEVRRSRKDAWVAYRRYGDRVCIMRDEEKIDKLFQGVINLPKEFRANVPELKFNSVDGSKVESYIKWSVKNTRDIYKWIGTGLGYPIILLPVPLIPLRGHSKVYYTSSMWHGNIEDYEKFLKILTEIENILEKSTGISFEVWSLWTPLSKHDYFTGCNAQGLVECIENMSQKPIKFAWILYSTVTILVIGRISENSCIVEVRSVFNFIPNNYPFISIDEVGRVVTLPLPARESTWWTKELIKEWKLPPKEELWQEDIPDELLEQLPSTQIIGYLSEIPRPRRYDVPFRISRGLTLIDIKEIGKLPEGTPPLITDVNPLFTILRSAPRGLNDLKEVKIVGMNLEALIMPEIIMHDMAIVLFSLECHVNQSKLHRITQHYQE